MAEIPTDWQGWLREHFPRYTAYPFAPHHVDFWEWVWAIRSGQSSEPFVALWPRGGAKSTSVELSVAAMAAFGLRHYALLISETQAQADDHVGSVARMMESAEFARVYPDVSDRALGKFGNPLGWRQNRLRTRSGFTLDAVGLDSAARGVKLDEHRPDLIILDDIDSETDSKAAVDRKITMLTTKLLPAGSSDVVVLAVQNKVHADSVFAQLADGRADFLADRIVSGPIPALQNAEYQQTDGKWEVVAGTPTWAGQDLAACQAEITRFGLTAFRAECQHEVDEQLGGMFDHVEFRHCEWSEVPDLVRVVVWVDPAVTDKDSSDAHGIQADGLAADGMIYRLFSWEDRTSPEDSLRRALLKAVELHAECVGVETDQGGDTWRSVYDAAWRQLTESGTVASGAHKPQFRSEKAGAGYGPKAHRAAQMLADYERGRFVHVRGTHQALERALRRFPKVKPYDLTDASFWAWEALTKRSGGRLMIV